MSDLARELRALAAIYFRAGNVEHASCCHAHALILETHAARRSDDAWIDWPSADAMLSPSPSVGCVVRIHLHRREESI